MYSQLTFRANWIRHHEALVVSVSPAAQCAMNLWRELQSTRGAPSYQTSGLQTELLAQTLTYLLARLKPFLRYATCQNYLVDALQTALALPEKTVLQIIATAVAQLIDANPAGTTEGHNFDPFMVFILASSLLARNHDEFVAEFAAGRGFQHLMQEALQFCDSDDNDRYEFAAEATAHTAAILADFATNRDVTPWYVEQQLFATLLEAEGYGALLDAMGVQPAFALLVAIGMENQVSLKQLVALWTKRVKTESGYTEQLLPQFVAALEVLDLAFVEGLPGSPQMALALTHRGVKLTQAAFKAQTSRLPAAVRHHRAKKATKLYSPEV